MHPVVPAVVHIHGGGFWGGSKSAHHAVRYAELGFVGVSINYRLSGLAPFPAAVHDCKAAIRWLRANAEKYHIDADHIGVWGTSTGGYLAAIMGTSGGDPYLEGYGGLPTHTSLRKYRQKEELFEFSSDVQAVVDHFGPTDFLKLGGNHTMPTSAESRFLGGQITGLKEQVRRAKDTAGAQLGSGGGRPPCRPLVHPEFPPAFPPWVLPWVPSPWVPPPSGSSHGSTPGWSRPGSLPWSPLLVLVPDLPS